MGVDNLSILLPQLTCGLAHLSQAPTRAQGRLGKVVRAVTWKMILLLQGSVVLAQRVRGALA